MPDVKRTAFHGVGYFCQGLEVLGFESVACARQAFFYGIDVFVVKLLDEFHVIQAEIFLHVIDYCLIHIIFAIF